MSNISTAAPSSNFFISFKIKPDVTFIGFTNKNRIFTPFWYQNCKNCKVVLPIRIWIWMKYSWNLLMCNTVIIPRGANFWNIISIPLIYIRKLRNEWSYCSLLKNPLRGNNVHRGSWKTYSSHVSINIVILNT